MRLSLKAFPNEEWDWSRAQKGQTKQNKEEKKTRLQHQGEYGYPVRELEVQFGVVEREEWGQ